METEEHRSLVRPSSRANEIAIKVTLVILALGTMSPVIAVFDTAAIGYYGVLSREPMVVALLQHRGVLQLALGAALVWAAFYSPARIPVAIGAAFTKASYILLLFIDPVTRPLMPPFSTWFDGIAILLLALIAVAAARRRSTTTVSQ